MATMTIRNLDDQLKARLRVRAAEHGRSMEDEARDILRTALSKEAGDTLPLAAAIRARLAPLGGVELAIPPREPIRDPVDLES
ncbi:MAG: Arc family DNA-binding protein [Alcanivorax sp.]|nr:Arc family DNA-binding protein [Alcanivorax sp.]